MKTLFTVCLIPILILSSGIAINAFANEDYLAILQSTSVSAECAAVYQANTDTFIYGKNDKTRHPMASTTKIMTALVAIEKSNPDDIVKIAKEAVGVEGSSVYLKENEEISMENLLYALLLQSANDAAAAIAYHISGSIEEFALLMNKKASEIGAKDTNFTNPHGLDDDNHYTTSRDLAIISAKALEDELFREIVSCKKKTITDENGDITRVLVNHNKLLHLFEGAIGVKTGYTKKTGRCLVSAAEKNGILMICVTLDAPSDWSDHCTLLSRAFDCYESTVVANIGDISIDMPMLGGGNIKVINSEALIAVSEKGENSHKLVYDINRYAVPPVREGDLLGRVYLYYGDKIISSSPLVAKLSR